jgi:hypothetical protein
VKLTSALFSGHFCNKLQLRSPKTLIGLLNVRAVVKLGFNSSSRQDSGQSGGLYVTQITKMILYIYIFETRADGTYPEVEVLGKSFKTLFFNGTRL